MPTRSIPASAGNPPSGPATATATGVHPRERGESQIVAAQSNGVEGPSPRARGIPAADMVPRSASRSIPASAGNPRTTSRASSAPPVHPRERGESAWGDASAWASLGPSPRARGIPDQRRLHDACRRSIPASAGNPRRACPGGAGRWVHPRERGESGAADERQIVETGPSPRARGIRAGAVPAVGSAGSIPASAGNPASGSPARWGPAVHPRERGESRVTPPPPRTFGGPSPRARGIPSKVSAPSAAAGSIPASAGNPSSGWGSARTVGVHPRERGESWLGRKT